MKSPEQVITYRDAGVDTEKEEAAMSGLVQRLKQTWPLRERGAGSVQLDIGFFATVIELDRERDLGLAMTTDSAGTKVLIAQMMEKYDTIGIDCVAMNVNDLLCVGATPISMLDYLAVEDPTPHLLEEIAKGLHEGARQAQITIPGGETAQVRDILKGHKEGLGFDLAGMAIGTLSLKKIIVGQKIEEGDVVIGLQSNGIHSNGLTLARRVFFEGGRYTVHSRFEELDGTLGEELLKPTHIYVREVVEMLNSNLHVKALIHITSDGLLNLTRVASATGYVIDFLPPSPPIFSLIQRIGHISEEEMFQVYNMGIGFCIVVPEAEADQVIAIAEKHQKRAYHLGYAVRDPEKKVIIRPRGLIGKGSQFLRDR